ncbi:MAG: MFS transporter [Chloroflexi bacterium]|nr:MFS transporter [Chloroflexota bacterium]
MEQHAGPQTVSWTGLYALLSGTFAAVLSLSFLFAATPLIMQDFGVSIEGAAWLSLSYALGATVFEPMFGRLGDIHGRKRNVLVGLAVFTFGALVAAVSPHFMVMVAARFVQGLGAAAVIPVGMAFIGENFPSEMRGRALGVWSMVNGVGPAIGPTLGGLLIDSVNWRAIYWVSLVLGLVGIALVAAFMPESRRGHREPFDYAGSAALFVAVGSLLTLLTQGRAWGWTSASSLLLAASALIGIGAFLWQERRASHPIIDLHFAGSQVFLMPASIVFLSFFAFQGSFFMLPFFLEQVQGYAARQVGTMAIPLFVALAGASFFGGRISDRFRAKQIVLAGTLLTAVAIYLLTWVKVNTPYWYMLGVMAFLGLGVGVTLPP